ncbi:MAG: hypothetical protein R3C26_05715 [Calditrichia bacterium]
MKLRNPHLPVNTGRKTLMFLLILTVFSKIHAQQENIVLRFWVDLQIMQKYIAYPQPDKNIRNSNIRVNIQLEVFKDFQTFFLDRYQSTSLKMNCRYYSRRQRWHFPFGGKNEMIQPLDTKYHRIFV